MIPMLHQRLFSRFRIELNMYRVDPVPSPGLWAAAEIREQPLARPAVNRTRTKKLRAVVFADGTVAGDASRTALAQLAKQAETTD